MKGDTADLALKRYFLYINMNSKCSMCVKEMEYDKLFFFQIIKLCIIWRYSFNIKD